MARGPKRTVGCHRRREAAFSEAAVRPATQNRLGRDRQRADLPKERGLKAAQRNRIGRDPLLPDVRGLYRSDRGQWRQGAALGDRERSPYMDAG